MPRSVLFVVPGLGGGGAERDIVNLANAMQSRGIKVGIATYLSGESYEAELSPEVDLMDVGPWPHSHLDYLRTIRKLLRQSRDYEVVVSALEMFTDRVVYYYGLFQRIRGIRQIYIAQVHITMSGYVAYRRKKANARMVRRIYPRFDAVVAVSHGVKKDLLELYRGKPDNISVLYNPLNLNRLREAAGEHVEGLERFQPYFINIGRLVEDKDQSNLLQAFRLFCQKQNGYHLLILGRGHCEEMLRGLAKELGLEDVVHFLGFQDNPWQYLSRAVCLVATSTLEGFSLVLGESLACGTPVIATDCPSGPRELLEDGRNGCLLPCRDPEAVARAMQEVLANPDAARARVANAAGMLARLDLPNVAAENIQFIDRLIKEKGWHQEGSLQDKSRV